MNTEENELNGADQTASTEANAADAAMETDLVVNILKEMLQKPNH